MVSDVPTGGWVSATKLLCGFPGFHWGDIKLLALYKSILRKRHFLPCSFTDLFSSSPKDSYEVFNHSSQALIAVNKTWQTISQQVSNIWVWKGSLLCGISLVPLQANTNHLKSIFHEAVIKGFLSAQCSPHSSVNGQISTLGSEEKRTVNTTSSPNFLGKLGLFRLSLH